MEGAAAGLVQGEIRGGVARTRPADIVGGGPGAAALEHIEGGDPDDEYTDADDPEDERDRDARAASPRRSSPLAFDLRRRSIRSGHPRSPSVAGAWAGGHAERDTARTRRGAPTRRAREPRSRR